MDLEVKNYMMSVLGIKHLWPSNQQESSPAPKAGMEFPSEMPKLIFLLLDAQDRDWSSQHDQIFLNILKAMKLEMTQVWRTSVLDMTVLDFLTHLRNRGWTSPIVVMTRQPLLQDSVSSMGAQMWIDVFSVSEMIKRPEVKKMSWLKMQEIMKQI